MSYSAAFVLKIIVAKSLAVVSDDIAHICLCFGASLRRGLPLLPCEFFRVTTTSSKLHGS